MIQKIIFSIFFFALPFILQSQEPDPIKKEINKLIKYESSISLENPKAFITHIIDQDTSFTHGFGAYNDLKDSILNTKTFELGSISKLFTSEIVQDVLVSKQINLKDEISDFFPELGALQNITILDLLNHTSGLSKRPEYIGKYEDDADHPYFNYQKEDFIKYLQKVKNLKPGTYKYSHSNYALLEILLERISEKSINQLFENKYDLKNSFFENSVETELETGYDFRLKETKPWKFNSFKGSLGYRSCLHDLDSWIRKLLTHDDLVETDYRIKTDKQDVFCELGWHIINHKKMNDIYLHTGRGAGHHTFLVVKPDTKTAVIVISNHKEGSGDLAIEILRMINDNWKRK